MSRQMFSLFPLSFRKEVRSSNSKKVTSSWWYHERPMSKSKQHNGQDLLLRNNFEWKLEPQDYRIYLNINTLYQCRKCCDYCIARIVNVYLPFVLLSFGTISPTPLLSVVVVVQKSTRNHGTVSKLYRGTVRLRVQSPFPSTPRPKHHKHQEKRTSDDVNQKAFLQHDLIHYTVPKTIGSCHFHGLFSRGKFCSQCHASCDSSCTGWCDLLMHFKIKDATMQKERARSGQKFHFSSISNSHWLRQNGF